MGLWDDVVNAGGWLNYALHQMLLAQPFITLQDPGTDDLPLRAVTALVPCLAWLVLLPALTLVRIAVARWVSCC